MTIDGTQTLLRQAVEYGCEYLGSLDERPVVPDAQALAALGNFDESLPAQPTPPADVLQQLHRLGSPATTANAGGRYFGYVNGGALPAALAGRVLADCWDQNAALQLMSPVAAKLESVCERWLVDLLRLPEESAVGMVSGTSLASLCGLLAGRNALLTRAGWDISQQGLFGAPALRVVMSSSAHATIRKALAMLGIGTAQIELVPADAQGRMDAKTLPPLDERTLLLVQAGNVNSGAFDPFIPLCEAARRAGAWVHVDGAFGLWARASAATQQLAEGVDRADSWSVDAHKTLNSPYDCGLIICRDRGTLAAALQANDAYIHFSGGRDGMLYTPEMSRRARGVELWAALKSLGRTGVDALVTQLCQRARQFAVELGAQGFHILNDVVFNQTLVACEKPELTTRTLENVQASGECWCSGTVWRGQPAIRVSVCSWMTTADDVRRSVAAFAAAREQAKMRNT
ncbi:MAG: aminotransferase class V-fold PLP-dependent enzyme [Chloroflexi bacterium]|nr:aminotransferase class V-fold PLP-dependent enzyme [Chloroflexota bacterium]